MIVSLKNGVKMSSKIAPPHCPLIVWGDESSHMSFLLQHFCSLDAYKHTSFSAVARFTRRKSPLRLSKKINWNGELNTFRPVAVFSGFRHTPPTAMRHFEANLTAAAPLSTFPVNAQSSVRVLCLPPPLCSFHMSCKTADLIADVWERCPSRSVNSLKQSRNPTNVSPGRKCANCVLGICQDFFFFFCPGCPRGAVACLRDAFEGHIDFMVEEFYFFQCAVRYPWRNDHGITAPLL